MQKPFFRFHCLLLQASETPRLGVSIFADPSDKFRSVVLLLLSFEKLSSQFGVFLLLPFSVRRFHSPRDGKAKREENSTVCFPTI